jgi:membrane-associated phospholipid phosphatase
MKKTLLKNRAFLVPYLLFFFMSGIFLILYPKGEAHLLINQYRSKFCDYFFSTATYLGDGVTACLLVIVLCFLKYRYAIFLGLSNVIASLITQILKHTIFADQVRPKKFFEGIAELKLIPWVENYSYNSFPSGHSTTAFATLCCFAMLTNNKYLQFCMFCIALTIGVSRVYLSQHFLNDVIAGSIIGVTTSLFTYKYIFEIGINRAWMEKSILN